MVVSQPCLEDNRNVVERHRPIGNARTRRRIGIVKVDSCRPGIRGAATLLSDRGATAPIPDASIVYCELRMLASMCRPS